MRILYQVNIEDVESIKEFSGHIAGLPAEFNHRLNSAGEMEYLYEAGTANTQGTRCIYYYAEKQIVVVTHLYSGRVHLIYLSDGSLRWFDYHKVTVRDVQIVGEKPVIIASSWDGSVTIVDLATLELLHRFSENDMGRCPYSSVSGDSGLIASLSYDSDKDPALLYNRVRIWSMADGRLKEKISLASPHIGRLRCGTSFFHGPFLYCSSSAGVLQVFNHNGSELIRNYNVFEEIHSLYYLSCRNTLLTASRSGTIYGLELNTGILQPLTHRRGYDILFLTGTEKTAGEIVVATCDDGTMHVMEGPDLQPVISLKVLENYLWTAACIRNDLIVTGGDDSQIFIYNMKELNNIYLVATLSVYDDSFTLLTADGSGFYSTDPAVINVYTKPDKTAVDGKKKEYLLHSANSFSVMRDVFHPDGKILAPGLYGPGGMIGLPSFCS